MHVVVVGCGRVGSALARNLIERRPHRRRHRQAAGGVRPARAGLHRPDDRRRRLRPRPPHGGRHRAGRRARRRDQRRQLQHPDRPRRPGDLRRRAGRGPHLRPPPGRHLPAPRHPHRRHRGRGRPSGCCAASCPTSRRSSGSTRAPRCASSSGRSPAPWAGHPLSRPRGAGHGAGRGGRPPRRRPDPDAPTSSSRRATSSTSPWPATRIDAVDELPRGGPAKGGH